jgi:hypothetical protein
MITKRTSRDYTEALADRMVAPAMTGTALRGPSRRGGVAGVAAEVAVDHGKLQSAAIAWTGHPSLTGEDAQNVDGYDLAKSRRGSSLSDQKPATSLI